MKWGNDLDAVESNTRTQKKNLAKKIICCCCFSIMYANWIAKKKNERKKWLTKALGWNPFVLETFWKSWLFFFHFSLCFANEDERKKLTRTKTLSFTFYGFIHCKYRFVCESMRSDTQRWHSKSFLSPSASKFFFSLLVYYSVNFREFQFVWDRFINHSRGYHYPNT